MMKYRVRIAYYRRPGQPAPEIDRLEFNTLGEALSVIGKEIDGAIQADIQPIKS